MSALAPGGNKVAPEKTGSFRRTAIKVDDTDDDIMDHYLKLPKYIQTKHSVKMAIHSVWKKQVEAFGAEQTKERLKSFWTTIGVVSALVLGVSYSAAISPVTSPDPDYDMAASVVQVLNGISLMLSLAVIVISVTYIIEIDNCTTERDLSDFIKMNSSVVDGLTGVFSASVVLLTGAALGSMYINYGLNEFLIVACVTGFIILAGAVFAAIVAGHNRFRLWIRYASPLALERKAQRDAAAAKAEAEAEAAAAAAKLGRQGHGQGQQQH